MSDPLSNFIDKFQNVWRAGKDARLVIECQAGQAWISIHQHIGLPPPPPKQHHRRPGPARLRRSARRAQARAEAENVFAAAITAEMAVQTDQPPQTLEAAVQAEPVRPNPPHVVPAEQAGPANDQQWAAQAHQVSDAFCPDRMFQTAEKARPTQHDIPQLDGQQDLDGSQQHPQHVQQGLQKHQCDNCQAAFENKQQLYQHSESHGYGCDDCFICYTSKFLVDLHELQVHPETSYARDHIPESTKIEFAARNRTR